MGSIRVLTRRDQSEVRRVLALRPIDNVLVASRVARGGVERVTLGNDLIGYWEAGRLVSLLSDGYSLHPVGATPAALDAFAGRLEHRRCTSIVGVRDEAMGLWQRLCDQSFTQWASPRDVRDHQQVMAISDRVRVGAETGVAPVGTRHLDSYLEAAVAMYTEEVGVAPLDPQGAYRDHVAGLMMKGQAYGVVDRGRVVFKADVVAAAGRLCQVGGVWLAPELRGLGLSESLMAGVVTGCRRTYPTVTLYVNSYNLAAVRCYTAVGFTTVSECATILY
ncbi:MAG: GNAT family N-acetyltransferase [Propionibacteriaceae bacterium]|jgi:predicted GNAT family acetyltransferase|nr:GNAT family N-acetyltransferase [Propionibacteriaceae bacterium]